MMTDQDVKDRLELAVAAARKAGQLTLAYFQQSGLAVERKTDGTPVTVADRSAEELLREEIERAFPRDAILGEEWPDRPGNSGFQWYLDPIDGTKSFVHGVPLYGTLVGVEYAGGGVTESADGWPTSSGGGGAIDSQWESQSLQNVHSSAAIAPPGPEDLGHPSSRLSCHGPYAGRCVLGVVVLPALGEYVYAARGQGAWHVRGDSAPCRARVSSVSKLEDSLFCFTSVSEFHKRGREAAFETLRSGCRLARGWGDCYGYVLVATGRAEVMVDPTLNVWDMAALPAILEEAGGTFTDWQGNATIRGGEGVGTNGRVFEEVMGVTRGN